MNEYTIITAQGTRNGFVVEAWDMGGAIAKAQEYFKKGWKIFGIVSSGEIYDSERLLNLIKGK